MRLHRPQRRQAGENVIPLINVALLLLVFFLLAGRLADPLPFPADPPAARSGDPATHDRTVVLIGADGQLAIDGRPVDLDGLRGDMARRTDAEEDRRVTVRADAAVEAAIVISVLRALQSSGVGDVKLLTRSEPP